ncbi:MAG: hypothetical protein WBR13_04105 [Allosphingosinicella sp.]
MGAKNLGVLRLCVLPALLLAGSGVEAGPAAKANKSIEGAWVGDFGAGNWTFKFQGSGRAWAGQYTYPQYKGWNPVINLAASDRAARFSLKARTAVGFNLKLHPSNNALTGTVRFAQGMKPGSAPVTLPVTLKRISP